MFKVFSTAHEVYEAQLHDIERAKHTIMLEQYIISDLADGEIGRTYIEALIRKQREGVEVRCILDAQGSFKVFRHLDLNAQMSDSGVQVLYYKTLGLSNIIYPMRFILRDHRKLLLIDEKISWIGGVVVGEEFRDWNDLMVRFTSPAIAETLRQEFNDQFLRLQEKESLLAPLRTIDEKHHICGNAPGIGNRFCYEEICHAIMRARRSVVLVTPYFVPPVELLRVILRRLREGLSITLFTPRHTDSRLVDLARESFMKKLLEHGLVLKYSERMNHAKIIMADGEWMTFGSTNLDAVSLIFNHELNIVTRNNELIREVTDVVNRWMDGLEPVTFDKCEYHNQSFVGKFVGRCCRYCA